MPRYVRRRIRGNFNQICFKPCGMPTRSLKTVELTKDEMEAIRLADFENLYHEEAADKMEISRATFGRILNLARKKVADALINAKTIRILDNI